MRIQIFTSYVCLALTALFTLPLCADEPIIPPSITSVSPAGMERGTTATFTIDGRNLSGANAVFFDAPGITAKVTQITDVPEKISGPRAGVDLGAQVPLGRKQTTKLEISVSKEIEPGLHWFRLRSPLGTSNLMVIAIGSLPEIYEKSPGPDATQPQSVSLPATLVGTIRAPGERADFLFHATAGEELVFQVLASPLGSQLKSLLVLRDASGSVVGQAGENSNQADASLTSKLPHDGDYTLSISDREKGGGYDHFFRINAGPLPYVTEVFPLGVRSGQADEVAVEGVNLGGIQKVKVESRQHESGWATIPLEVKTSEGSALNKVRLAVGNEPEILEQEPNNTPAQAQNISLPVTINGRIDGSAKAQGSPDEDYFRFHARQGESITLEVAASRLGSPLDSVIEVLDAQGHPIPRATVRCLNQTTTTLADRDSRAEGIRLVSTSGIHEGDFLMVGDEMDRVAFVPDQPDADIILKGINGQRLAYLGTSPDVRAVNTPVYKAQILSPGTETPANGLPVFHLAWRNDDGGPGYGADSRLDFIAPRDGDYIVRLADVRGLEGPDFAYRLTVRDSVPDFQLSADPGNPNIPAGGSIPIRVSANRQEGYEGRIEIEVKGLPPGVTARAAAIPAGQDSTVLILTASPNASSQYSPAPIQILGHAKANGLDLVRTANKGAPLQIASVTPPPDVVVAAEPNQIALEPGKETTVTLHVERQNGFKGRVPCNVENLPPGVRVVNVGLNGVLVTETQTSRTFTLRAEDWAKPITQPIYVVAEVESNSPTRHPSSPLILKVAGEKETAAASQIPGEDSRQLGKIGSPH